MLISASLHAVLLLGFGRHAVPPKAVAATEPPAELLIMPDLTDPEEKKVEELADDTVEAPSVAVPMLADVPVSIMTDAAFVQPLEYVVPLTPDAASAQLVTIPPNIQHGRPNATGIKNLFEVSELDRAPEPIAQMAPEFPYEMQRLVASGHVVVGFIVTNKGEVVQAYIVSSSDRGFEHATLVAVSKWKFRPGVKAGHKVNTRVEQPVNFKLSAHDQP